MLIAGVSASLLVILIPASPPLPGRVGGYSGPEARLTLRSLWEALLKVPRG